MGLGGKATTGGPGPVVGEGQVLVSSTPARVIPFITLPSGEVVALGALTVVTGTPSAVRHVLAEAIDAVNALADAHPGKGTVDVLREGFDNSPGNFATPNNEWEARYGMHPPDTAEEAYPGLFVDPPAFRTVVLPDVAHYLDYRGRDAVVKRCRALVDAGVQVLATTLDLWTLCSFDGRRITAHGEDIGAEWPHVLCAGWQTPAEGGERVLRVRPLRDHPRASRLALVLASGEFIGCEGYP